MSAAQWEALAERLAGFVRVGPEADRQTSTERGEHYRLYRSSYLCWNDLDTAVSGLALFAKLMALVERKERFTGETDPLGPGDFANGNADDHEGFFRMSGRFLFEALRAYHAGADHGELRALLVEAWGPSPAVKLECTGLSASWCPICGDCTCTDPEEAKDDPNCPIHGPTSRHGEDEDRLVHRCASDLRGLAARESQPPRNIRDAQAADELADLARGPRL